MANTTNTAPARVRLARNDISITWILLWLTAIAVAAATVGWSLYSWLRGKPLLVAVQAADNGTVPDLDAAGVNYQLNDVPAIVQVAHPSVAQRLLDLSSEAVEGAAIIVGLLLAARVVRAVLDDNLFTPRLVSTLRVLGVYVAIAGFAVPLIQFLPLLALQDSLNLPIPLAVTISFGTLPLPWQWFLIGTFLGVLAEAANRARRMQDDLEGLV